MCSFGGALKEQSGPKVELLSISKTRLDLECAVTAFNKHAACKNSMQEEQSLNIFGSLYFVTVAGIFLALMFLECHTGALQVRSRL